VQPLRRRLDGLLEDIRLGTKASTAEETDEEVLVTLERNDASGEETFDRVRHPGLRLFAGKAEQRGEQRRLHSKP
jgi:hypothetical protein